MPSYEERRAQMEGILKASVTNSYYGEPGSVIRTPSMDVLRELIDSRYTVYDVLPTFWNYSDQEIIHGKFTVYSLRVCF